MSKKNMACGWVNLAMGTTKMDQPILNMIPNHFLAMRSVSNLSNLHGPAFWMKSQPTDFFRLYTKIPHLPTIHGTGIFAYMNG